MEVILEQFQEIVDNRLKELGWSRSDLARSADVSRQMVTDYLNGRVKPGPDVIEKFFRAIGLKPLLTFEEIEKPKLLESVR